MTGTWAAADVLLRVDVCGDVVNLIQLMGQPNQQSANVLALHTDGRSRLLEGYGFEMRSRWIDTRTLATVATRGAATVGNGRYAVTEDGNSLIFSTGDTVLHFKRVSR